MVLPHIIISPHQRQEFRQTNQLTPSQAFTEIYILISTARLSQRHIYFRQQLSFHIDIYTFSQQLGFHRDILYILFSITEIYSIYFSQQLRGLTDILINQSSSFSNPRNFSYFDKIEKSPVFCYKKLCKYIVKSQN